MSYNEKKAGNMLRALPADKRAEYEEWAAVHQADGNHVRGIPPWRNGIGDEDEGHINNIVNPPPAPAPAAPKPEPPPRKPTASKPRLTFGEKKAPAPTTSRSAPPSAEPYEGARADFEAIMRAPVWVAPCSASKSWEAFAANVPNREVFGVVERAMVRLDKHTAADEWRASLLVFLRDKQFLVGSGSAYVPRAPVPAIDRGCAPKFVEPEV